MRKILLAFLLFSLVPLFSAFADETQNLNATATVPDEASDYTASIQSLSGTAFSQDQTIEYKITYGTYLSYPSHFTLEASWSKGTIEGESQASQSILDYVVGSASNAYGSSAPVIDSTNRKITWTVSSFPANTQDQTVTFSLRTNSSYTGSTKVNFSVSTRIVGVSASTDYSTLNQAYKYLASTGTSSPTPTPSAAPIPVKSAEIKEVEIREITKDYATVFVETTGLSTKSLYFGTSFSLLGLLKTSPSLKGAIITLDKLKPNTQYFFKVYTSDSSGNKDTSDVFTFKTAEDDSKAVINNASLVVTSDNVILSSSSNSSSSTASATLVIPEDTLFKFKFSLATHVPVKNIQVVVRKANVLGITNIAEASTESVDVIEVAPGVYEGSLRSRLEHGAYELIARISDTKGNIIEQKISTLRIINKFTVISSDKSPVDAARVELYVYSPGQNKYIKIPAFSLSSSNPLFTDKYGRLNLALPFGKYRAYVSSLGYKDKWLDFKIGSGEKEDLPIVVLEKGEFNAYNVGRYYFRSINDVFLRESQSYVLALTGSPRFFNLVATFTLAALVILTLLAFSKKHHINFSSLPHYFYFLLTNKRNPDKYIKGVIIDKESLPIAGAKVYLSDSKNEEILSSTTANKRGEFYFRKTDAKDKYFVIAMARMYKSSPLIAFKSGGLRIKLEKQQQGFNIWGYISRVFFSVAAMSFESLFVITFIFEIFFIANFGIVKTLPFLTVSLFNLSLWSLYLRHKHIAES